MGRKTALKICLLLITYSFWLVTSFLNFGSSVLADFPSTNTYKLNSFGFGSGGTANSTTPNYGLEGISGEISGQTANTSTYQLKPAYIETQQANVPTITLTNPSNYYDKLKFVIGQQNNPDDALYALQISTTSDFSSDISYVKSDFTIGTTLTISDYQTYTLWGGVSGHNIIGLASSTTYYLRAKATQGKFTESAYGPSSNAATVGQQLSYCLYTNSDCGSGGNSIAFGTILPGGATNSPNNIGVDFATNANGGGNVFIYSANGGLTTTHAAYTITSATADLASVSQGYGAQILSVGQGSGGPFSKVSPYDGSSGNVGALNIIASRILNSANPITGGTSSIRLKARPSTTTPAATDYSDTLTLIAAANF